MERGEYLRRLRVLKDIMPKYYAVVAKLKHPEVKSTTYYNVVTKETYNVEALLALEDTFLTKETV